MNVLEEKNVPSLNVSFPTKNIGKKYRWLIPTLSGTMSTRHSELSGDNQATHSLNYKLQWAREVP